MCSHRIRRNGLLRGGLRTILLLVMLTFCVALPTSAEDFKERVIKLPSGNTVLLNRMALLPGKNGKTIAFGYVSGISLNNIAEIRSEAEELFDLHLKTIAETQERRIVAAILIVRNDPKVHGDEIEDWRFNDVGFLRLRGNEWRMVPHKAP